MSDLRAVPRHLFSWGFDLFIGDEFLTSMDMNWLSEGGAFRWNGADYQLGRESLWAGDFFLRTGGRQVASAAKPNPFTRRFIVTCSVGECVFSAAHPLTRAFQLSGRDGLIGSIEPAHPFTRRCAIYLPDSLSIPEQVFLFWLAALMWRRAQNSSS